MEHLYLLGKGIAHSKSPDMYNALYDSLGLDWLYELADLPTEAEARALLEGGEWLSINVTTPYKPLALQACQVKAASVQLAGGANMLFRREGKVVGLNTDGVGCVRHIEREGHSFSGTRVAVCGTGPTALAIYVAAATAGADRVTLIGRDRDKAAAAANGVVRRYRDLAYSAVDLRPDRPGWRSFREAYEQPSFAFGTYASAGREIAAADIVIDATPLGMSEGDPLPFPEDLLGGQRLVYDVVYGHGESKLLVAARAAGCATLDGRGMLVAQAVENASVLLDSQDARGDAPDSLEWDALYDLMESAAAFA